MGTKRAETRWAEVIGANVRSCRTGAGMTQSRLAGLIGSTVPVVSRMESGTHLPSLRTVLKVAGALGVSLARLLEGLDIPPAGEPGPAARRKRTRR
jgi:transcriptional regulator with XRE-family HTH domain